MLLPRIIGRWAGARGTFGGWVGGETVSRSEEQIEAGGIAGRSRAEEVLNICSPHDSQ